MTSAHFHWKRSLYRSGSSEVDLNSYLGYWVRSEQVTVRGFMYSLVLYLYKNTLLWEVSHGKKRLWQDCSGSSLPWRQSSPALPSYAEVSKSLALYCVTAGHMQEPQRTCVCLHVFTNKDAFSLALPLSLSLSHTHSQTLNNEDKWSTSPRCGSLPIVNSWHAELPYRP